MCVLVYVRYINVGVRFFWGNRVFSLCDAIFFVLIIASISLVFSLAVTMYHLFIPRNSSVYILEYISFIHSFFFYLAVGLTYDFVFKTFFSFRCCVNFFFLLDSMAREFLHSSKLSLLRSSLISNSKNCILIEFKSFIFWLKLKIWSISWKLYVKGHVFRIDQTEFLAWFE